MDTEVPPDVLAKHDRRRALARDIVDHVREHWRDDCGVAHTMACPGTEIFLGLVGLGHMALAGFAATLLCELARQPAEPLMPEGIEL